MRFADPFLIGSEVNYLGDANLHIGIVVQFPDSHSWLGEKFLRNLFSTLVGGDLSRRIV
jgi:hypothetical protein